MGNDDWTKTMSIGFRIKFIIICCMDVRACAIKLLWLECGSFDKIFNAKPHNLKFSHNWIVDQIGKGCLCGAVYWCVGAINLFAHQLSLKSKFWARIPWVGISYTQSIVGRRPIGACTSSVDLHLTFNFRKLSHWQTRVGRIHKWIKNDESERDGRRVNG